jgi:hypothetical protein
LWQGCGDDDREPCSQSAAATGDEGRLEEDLVVQAAADRHSRGDDGSDEEEGEVGALPALGECDRRQVKCGDAGRKPKSGFGDAERFLGAWSWGRAVERRLGRVDVFLLPVDDDLSVAAAVSAQSQKFSQLPGR